jgi:hypothetical protein
MEQNNSGDVTPEVDEIWVRVQTNDSFRILDVTLDGMVQIQHLSRGGFRDEGSLQTFRQAVDAGRLAPVEEVSP